MNDWRKTMKKYVVILMMLSVIPLMVGCAAIKQVPITNYQKDTIVIKELIRDTLIVPQIQKEYIEVTTKDTISILNTELASSTASIKDNQLHHSLEQKQPKTPIKIQYKDRIVEKVRIDYKEVPVEIEIEKPYIPKWCWIIICYAALMAGITIMKIVNKFR